MEELINPATRKQLTTEITRVNDFSNNNEFIETDSQYSLQMRLARESMHLNSQSSTREKFDEMNPNYASEKDLLDPSSQLSQHQPNPEHLSPEGPPLPPSMIDNQRYSHLDLPSVNE